MPLIVVTGASQGLGRAVARAFASEPSAVLALMSRSQTALEETAALCRREGADASVWPCDVTDDAAVERTARGIMDRHGVPDVLVNNAGAFRPGSLVEMTAAHFRDQIEVNLTSAFVVTRAFLPHMILRRSGHLFFMASVASIKAYPSGIGYGAAKHGLLGLARCIREELKPAGIRVTTLLPGASFTASWEGTDLPEERFIPPEDVAATLVSAWKMSNRTVVEEILLRPQLGDI